MAFKKVIDYGRYCLINIWETLQTLHCAWRPILVLQLVIMWPQLSSAQFNTSKASFVQQSCSDRGHYCLFTVRVYSHQIQTPAQIVCPSTRCKSRETVFYSLHMLLERIGLHWNDRLASGIAFCSWTTDVFGHSSYCMWAQFSHITMANILRWGPGHHRYPLTIVVKVNRGCDSQLVRPRKISNKPID